MHEEQSISETWNDQASQSLGIETISIFEGGATVSMTVTDSMVNGLAVCHGGFLFTLADTAMAVASNSSADLSVAAFAVSAHIEFVSPAKRGDRLMATAVRQLKQGRAGFYDVTVRIEPGSTSSSDDRVVAFFRGKTVDTTR
jgi:acyl-CoA thioesterase